MNLKKAQKNLEKMFDKQFKDKFEMEYEHKDNMLMARTKTKLTIASLDTTVFFQLTLFDNGFAMSNFIFDDIEKNAHTLDLINEYNNNCEDLVAFIDEDNGLQIEHHCLLIDEETIADYTLRVLRILVVDDFLKYLKPLTDLTTESE